MGLRILVVDDDAMMLQMLPPVLEKMETRIPVHAVLTAQTPKAALDALDKLPQGPTLVLSDFNLKAELNGVDVLREVQRRRPDAVRVLFSGYALDQIGDAGRDPAAHGFIEKPMRIRELVEPLKEIVDRELTG